MNAHAALIFHDSQDLQDRLAAARPPENTVIVTACRPEHHHAVTAALAGYSTVRIERPDIHTRPAAALAAYRRLPGESSVGNAVAITVIAEPDTGDTTTAWARAARCEAATDLTLADTGISLICAYPATTSAALLADIMRTHPVLLTAHGRQRNPEHLVPETMLHRLTARRSRPAPPHQPALRIVSRSMNDLGDTRAKLAAHLTGLPALMRTDFVAAINEIATNAYCHGAPPVTISLWVREDAVECRITDHGAGVSDPTLGYRPRRSSGRRTGAGLWLARQLCDDLDMWTADVFTVRIASAYHGQQPGARGAVARAEVARLRADRLDRRLQHLRRLPATTA